jgi:hypothetical protein
MASEYVKRLRALVALKKRNKRWAASPLDRKYVIAKLGVELGSIREVIKDLRGHEDKALAALAATEARKAERVCQEAIWMLEKDKWPCRESFCSIEEREYLEAALTRFLELVKTVRRLTQAEIAEEAKV